MRKTFISIAASAVCLISQIETDAQVFNKIPVSWKWVSKDIAAFSYDGSYTDSAAFAFNVKGAGIMSGFKAPEKYMDFPVHPDKAVNLTYSPDSSMLAFTRNNDLYVYDISTGHETRLTHDGSQVILNGYASWVYYEEILGRPSMYRAFWWSPDSKRIGFYRFDNSDVPVFPIYSPFGQDGELRNTRYPKAGEPNPVVKIGIVNVDYAISEDNHGPSKGENPNHVAGNDSSIVWADFEESSEQYFGIPFWSADSKDFYVAREPRIQNTLDLYRVSVIDGSKKHVYHEESNTWLDWIDGMLFTDKGLYMARDFETGWQQIYFLSYDGSELRRITDGPNWRVNLIRAEQETGDVYFTACRESSVRQSLYKANASGGIIALTDTSLNVSSVKFSPDGRHFIASLSGYRTPTRVLIYNTKMAGKNVYQSGKGKHNPILVADMTGPEFRASDYALPELIYIENDGLRLPGAIVYPRNFDPSEKYPVHMDIYGGPDTPLVRDRWTAPSDRNQWWSENGIIQITADCRAAGHNGRAGLDQIYRHLNTVETDDFVAWARYLQSLPYVRPDKIGVEGFSFGGTMTAMLLFTASDYFHYGIAGGGVYDWQLYDTHYTERFMETPQTNPEGYAGSRVINHVSSYPATYPAGEIPVMLKLTHGTGDDNVHFQNTLQLIDELQKQGKHFEFMIYPDAMHGYRGYQGAHSIASDHDFWLRHLLGR